MSLRVTMLAAEILLTPTRIISEFELVQTAFLAAALRHWYLVRHLALPTVGAHSASFLLTAKQMSFWAQSPGPTWWDCIESLNPCHPPSYGLCSESVGALHEGLRAPPGFHLVLLTPKHADQVERLLKDHYSIYARCRIALSAKRIREGLLLDDWIGVGVFTRDNQLIGCCFSKPLGRMKFTHEVVDQGGVVDFFCVHTSYRNQGFAHLLLRELVFLTANSNRLVHVFLKEGFPLWNLPPLYSSHYVARRRGTPGPHKDSFGSMGIGLRGLVQDYTHAHYFPLANVVANLPWKLSGDSQLYGFSYKGHDVFLCMTDLHHRTVPEGLKVGELSWMLPKTIEVPLSIQRLAVETCVDCSSFDTVLMDKSIPHESTKGWHTDAVFSWYVFNYNPGAFFKVKPFWIF